MRKFDYTQTIPRQPVVSSHPALTRRHIKDMFDDYESHLVPEKTQDTISESDYSYVEGYIRWLFRVSHAYMVHAALED